VLLGCFGGLVAANFVKCPKSYYTEQFEKYGYIRDKYDTTYNTPTPYDPSLVVTHSFQPNTFLLTIAVVFQYLYCNTLVSTKHFSTHNCSGVLFPSLFVFLLYFLQLNEADGPMLLAGCRDGTVRVYRNYTLPGEREGLSICCFALVIFYALILHSR